MRLKSVVFPTFGLPRNAIVPLVCCVSSDTRSLAVVIATRSGIDLDHHFFGDPACEPDAATAAAGAHQRHDARLTLSAHRD